ncbi:hypothetical protein RSAG8_04117, partial [Rhizoctonia solani AG-8 WAC10335]
MPSLAGFDPNALRSGLNFNSFQRSCSRGDETGSVSRIKALLGCGVGDPVLFGWDVILGFASMALESSGKAIKMRKITSGEIFCT